MRIENEIIMKGLDEIKPYHHNPRKNDKTVELLCEVLPKVGFNVPIVIDSDGVIVKGHARYLAAQKLGMDKVPCIVTHADPDSIKADRIADNKIFEFSEWVNEELMHEIDMLDLDFDLSNMGLPRISYDDIPVFDDFQFEEEEEEKRQLTDEERKKLYEEFLERQARENAVEVQMTTKGALEAAMYKQTHIPKPPRDYRKVICKKCGHAMYVDKNVLYGKDGTVRR